MAHNNGVVLVVLAVEDAQRAAAFYRGVFQWPVLVEVPVYVELQAGAVRVGLYQRDGFGRNTGAVPTVVARGALAPSELYVHVERPEDVMERLRRHGARELSGWQRRDWGDDAAYFADGDGHVVVVARPAG